MFQISNEEKAVLKDVYLHGKTHAVMPAEHRDHIESGDLRASMYEIYEEAVKDGNI